MERAVLFPEGRSNLRAQAALRCWYHRQPAITFAELLLMIRDEVLRRLSAQLPPEMRLMEAALAAPDAQQRLAMLKQNALLSTDAMPQEAEIVGSSEQDGGGSEGGSLYCLAADLEATVSRVIADMELLPTIPDRWGWSGWSARASADWALI